MAWSTPTSSFVIVLEPEGLSEQQQSRVIGLLTEAAGQLDGLVQKALEHGATHGLHHPALLGGEGGEGGCVTTISDGSIWDGTTLSGVVTVAITYWDERFTTLTAEQALLEGNVRRRRRKTTRDQVAAAVMLQGYLDRQAHDGRNGYDDSSR